MKSILLFVLLAVYLAAGFHCPPNVTQHLVKGDVTNNTFRFDVAIQNPSTYFLRDILLVPSTNMTVEGMNVTQSGLEFLDWLRGLPPHKTYHWSYTQDSAEPATFEVVVSECVNRTKNHHNHHGNHSFNNDTRPPAHPVPSAGPTETPDRTPATQRPTAEPTSGPTAGPTSAPTSTPSSAPTSVPTSVPTSAPTSAPSAPTSEPANTTISGKCSGSPRMLDGKPCASTTRYWDGNLGACGCGTSSGAFSWVADSYTAAASPPLFGSATNCGTGCGKCYKLTTTGYSPAGPSATVGQSITVMVTNLCPAGGEWCASGLNSFEYGAHFDLADSPTGNLISKLGWDNPEVVYEEVSCSGALTPTAADAGQCTCSA